MVAPGSKPLVYGLLNIITASGIVFANKAVFHVYGFTFPITLTWIHTLFTLVGTRVFARANMFNVKHIPKIKVLPLAVAYVGYIVLNNASLQINTVSFYQIAKIAVAPTVLVMEVLVLKRYPTWRVVAAVGVVCIGVALATVSDTQVGSNVIGLAVGFSAVFFTSLYQLWAGSKQKELGAGSNQLLHQYTPLAAAILGGLIPLLEPTGVGTGPPAPGTLLGFQYSTGALVAIVGSSVLGVLVTLSTFLFIGVTSSLTYNIVGHIKTVIILSGGYMFFGDEMPAKKMAGIGLAMVGIVWYTQLKVSSVRAQASLLPVHASDLNGKSSKTSMEKDAG